MSSFSNLRERDAVEVADISEGHPLQPCPTCEAMLDVSGHEPLAPIHCPGCGGALIVRGTIDHFRLTGVAGRGGMGVVYKAHDAGLDRDVALKVLRTQHSANDELVAQLEMEAAITAAVNDPNVVKVYSTGRDQGRFYIAMELVDKGSLDDLIQIQGRVAESQALDVGIQIARGLKAALQHGLIHRDVKPGNILFADAHTAKIVDFGLAIFMTQEESVRGEMWGTPYYVAPEKLDDKPEDFRSDIYSLGGTLFHAICGRPPFDAESASLVALKHLKNNAVSLQAFAPWVSGPTAYVINRTLLKDPDARYQSYDELIEHLEYAKAELENKTAHPEQASARVVLESKQTQRAMSWVTFGMIGAIAAVGFVAFVFRDALFHEDAAARATPRPVAGVLREVPSAQARLKPARDKLVAGDFAAAAAAFRKVADEGLQQPDLNWATVCEGLAELGAGRSVEAQAAFARIGQRGAFSNEGENGKLSEFFIRLARSMDGVAPIDPGVARMYDKSDHETAALLWFGIKNWQLGRVDDAVAFLRQFRSSSPRGSAAWIGELKPLATQYIGQFTDFEMNAEQLKSARNPEERLAAVEHLRAFPPNFAARMKDATGPFEAELAAFNKMRDKVPIAGIYKIINRTTGRSLNVDGFGTTDNANVSLYDYQGNTNQQWAVKPNSDGAALVIAEHSGMALDVENGKIEDGVNVRQHSVNGSPAQTWRIESTGKGWFKLVAACSGKVLAVAGGGGENQANVVQWTDNGTPDHEWRFVPVVSQVGEWTARDIGKDSLVGSTKLESEAGAMTLQAGGVDIWGEQDSCHAALQKVSGDFDLSGRVTGMVKTHDYTKGGFMVRETLVANARTVFVGVTPNRGAEHLRRTTAGARMSNTRLPEAKAPCWFKIERRGDTVTTFHSDDGVTWIKLDEDKLANLPASVFAGPAATSHDEGQITTVRLEHVLLKKL